MDQDTLVSSEPDIGAGRIVLTSLDEAELTPEAAFWIWIPERDRWWFVVAGGGLADLETPAAFIEIHGVLRALSPAFPIEIDEIAVESMDSPLIQLLSRLVRMAGVGGVRLTNNAINGVLIEDVYVYRLDPQPHGAKPDSLPAHEPRSGDRGR